MSPGRRIVRGFSLIELIVVIVVIGIGAVALLALFAGAAKSVGPNEDIQTAAQMAQECSEHVMAVRRNPAQGFASVTNAVCNVLPAPLPGFTRTVEVSDLTVRPPCTVATAGTCKQVAIKIAKGADTPAELTLMVVNY